MKVLALCHDPIPARFTNTEQLVWTMTELARLGHEVKILSRNSGQEGAPLRESIRDYYGLGAVPESIGFESVGAINGNGNTMFISGLTDALNVFRALKEKEALIYTRDAFALVLALAVGLPCVFETYKIYINKSARFTPWRKFCYSRKNLLGAVAHSELCRRSFIEAGLAPDRVETIYNGFPPAHFMPEISRETARARLNLNGAEHLATYAGHVDFRKGVETLLQIGLRLPHVKFLLLGGVAGSRDEEQVLSRIHELGLRNVSLVPRVPQLQVPVYLFASDCLIIPPSAEPLRKHGRTVLPMKTFSYLAAGRPIVAPDLVDLREILGPNENSILVAPDDVDAAAAAVGRLFTDRELAERLGDNARRDAAQYTWPKRAEKLSRFLQRVCARIGRT